MRLGKAVLVDARYVELEARLASLESKVDALRVIDSGALLSHIPGVPFDEILERDREGRQS